MYGYVINLARSFERRTHITDELKKTGMDYEIVAGIDGREVDLSDSSIVLASFAREAGHPKGTVGCCLSHVSVYRKIIEDGLDKALVLEDDAVLPADLGSLADAVGEQLVGAEVALLSVEAPNTSKLSPEGSVQLPSGRVLALPIDISQLRSGCAYIITRQACERMLKSMPPIKVFADAWWFFYREGMLDRVRCVAPLPVFKSSEFQSTIGYYSLGNGLRARLAGPFVSGKIPLAHQAISYRRQRIYHRWGRMELVNEPFVEKPSRLDEEEVR